MFNLYFIIWVLTVIKILPEDLIPVFMPIIVWLATGFVNWLKAVIFNNGFGGSILVSMIVPILSLLLSIIGSLITSESNFWQLFVLGLLSVFVNEVIKQWKQSIEGKQTKADKNLIG